MAWTRLCMYSFCTCFSRLEETTLPLWPRLILIALLVEVEKWELLLVAEAKWTRLSSNVSGTNTVLCVKDVGPLKTDTKHWKRHHVVWNEKNKVRFLPSRRLLFWSFCISVPCDFVYSLLYWYSNTAKSFVNIFMVLILARYKKASTVMKLFTGFHIYICL